MIFHLTSEKQWKQSLNGSDYRADSFEREGFIHFSSFGQILTVANLFYKTCADPVLLAVDNNSLSDLKWEGEDSLEFPHLYRPLKAKEVLHVIPLLKNSSGEFVSSRELERIADTVEIGSARLVLREFQLTDLDVVHSYASDFEVTKYVLWGPNSTTDTRNFMTRKFKEQSAKPRENYDFAVTCGQTGEFFGACGIYIIDQDSQTASLGYVLKKSAQGKGYATEFGKALVAFGFKNLNLYRIEATCDSENQASFNVMKKIGMQKEAFLRGNILLRDRRRNTVICSIVRGDFVS